MNVQFPDNETIRTVLALAARAPSVHNSQPWRWRVGDRRLHLHSDPSLHLPATDPDQRDLTLSCGATLHHCVVALAAMGWQAKVQRFPNPVYDRHVATSGERLAQHVTPERPGRAKDKETGHHNPPG